MHRQGAKKLRCTVTQHIIFRLTHISTLHMFPFCIPLAFPATASPSTLSLQDTQTSPSWELVECTLVLFLCLQFFSISKVPFNKERAWQGKTRKKKKKGKTRTNKLSDVISYKPYWVPLVDQIPTVQQRSRNDWCIASKKSKKLPWSRDFFVWIN